MLNYKELGERFTEELNKFTKDDLLRWLNSQKTNNSMKNQLAEKILGETQPHRAITDYLEDTLHEINKGATEQMSWIDFLDFVAMSCQMLRDANIEKAKDEE